MSRVQTVTKALGFLLVVYCSVVHLASGLSVTLSETDSPPPLPLEDSPRSIQLVPNKSYDISCEGDTNWFLNGTMVSSTVVPQGMSGVYVTTSTFSGNRKVLKLQLFSVELVGNYSCETDEMQFAIYIGTGNPVVIPSRVVYRVDIHRDGSSLPLIRVFGSGIPEPVPANYTWLFNDNVIYANNEVVDMGKLRDIEYNIITIPIIITDDIDGTYRSVVATQEGNASAVITLNVEVQPNPNLTVIQPTNYATESLAPGENVTLNCSDFGANPVPDFQWSISGVVQSGDEDGVTIATSNGGRESHMTRENINFPNGTVVKCEAMNIVEDKPKSTPKSLSLIVLASPPPPTNLTGRSLSSCRVELSWVLPPLVNPTDTLVPEEYVIEGRAGGENETWFIIDQTMSNTSEYMEVNITRSLGIQNITYDFRISSYNRRGGVSTYSTETTESLQLFYDPLPRVTLKTVKPLSPSSLQLTWTNPSTSCYSFSSHSISCNSSYTRANLSGSSASLLVPAPDSTYSCLVNSTIADLEETHFVTMTTSNIVSGFTYPNYPEKPSRPVAVGPGQGQTFPATNITVSLTRPTDHDSIDHYQVLVVRVRSEENLPETSPDQDYPAGHVFVDENKVNNRTHQSLIQGPYIAAEFPATSFTERFTLGDGPPSESSNPQYKNGPLLPSTKYSCFLRSFPRSNSADSPVQTAIFNSSDYMAVQETGPDDKSGSSSGALSDTVVGIIAGGVILFFILIAFLLFILFCCFCQRRRRKAYRLNVNSPSFSSSSKDSINLATETTPELCRKAPHQMELKPLDLGEEDSDLVPSGPIPLSDFRTHIEKFDENRQLLFQREFDWIQGNAPDLPAEASLLSINDDKNRYSNIKAYDHSRVKLEEVEGEEGSDYINANFIPGYKRTREYISTQGPLDQTVADFWNMIWEQNTATIVMLTNLVEAGKVKCAQYWPSPQVGSAMYGDIDVKLDNVAELRDYTIRNFTVTHVPSGKSHSVLQFHYTKWPDYGTPKLAAPLLNFLRAVHSANPGDAGPIVIHCSAGVGRSGTVICIDYCLAKLKADRVVDVRGFVSRMREHRNYMVQTEMQYAFIHFAVLEAITYGDTSFSLADFSQGFNQLQHKNKETGRTVLEEEYNRLGSVKTMSKASTFVQRVKQKGPTNRSIHYPGHASYSEGTNPHEYNAHFIDGYFTQKLFVVADGPHANNVSKFWQMVWDQDCPYLIMLTPLDAEYYRYWPVKGENESFGNIKVTVEEETAEHYYTTRVISLHNAKLGVSQKVTQYQFVGWTSQFLPPVPTFVSFVCDILQGVETLQRNQKALIHDTKSVGPAGIFCSLSFCIERLRVERMADVFQAVQHMQLQRPGSVASMQEYAFIYDCVYEYIRTHLSNN